MGLSNPKASPDECLRNAIDETSSIVGKCLAMVTARRLTANGRLSSRANSIRNPPAHKSALVLSSGMVIANPRWHAELITACT
jgi:hypothetical protein